MQKTTAISTKSSRGRVLSAVTLVLSISALTTGPVRAEAITLVETGSTLLYPLFNIWVANYTKTHPGVCITTASTGSEAGIQKILIGRSAHRCLRCFYVRHRGKAPPADRQYPPLYRSPDGQL